MFEDGAIAHVRGDHIGRQGFEREQGIFGDPHGIAGVQAGAHEILAGLFDKRLHFARLHVARMVLHRDAHAHVQRLRAHRAQHLDGVFDVGFERQRRAPIVPRAHVAAHHPRAHRLGHAQPAGDVLRGFAFFLVVRGR